MVGVSRHGAEEEASAASARRLWGFCVFGASGACGGGAATMEEETRARNSRQTHTFWCASLSERDAWLACLSQSIERAAGIPPVPLPPRTGWEAIGRDLVEELVDLAMVTCTNATKAGAAGSSAGSWYRKGFADLVEAYAALACDLTKDPAHGGRVAGRGGVGASGHRGVQLGGVTGCRGGIGEGHDPAETMEARDQLRLDAYVKALLVEKQALLAEKEALQQVSFASILGLFCLYNGSRLPLC